MAGSTSTTRVSDLIIPSQYAAYSTVQTAALSNLVQSGAIVRDPEIDKLLAGSGLTFNLPFFNSLADEDEDTSSDDPSVESTPSKLTTGMEIGVRLLRNKSWSSMDINAALMSPDPMSKLLELTTPYWTLRIQRLFIMMLNGILASNAVAPVDAVDKHNINDMTYDAAGTAYVSGVTNFNAANLSLAMQTMGDNREKLKIIIMHSEVYDRALRNNLINFIPDSTNMDAASIPTFGGKRVIVNDFVSNDGKGVYDTWIVGTGVFRFGAGIPKVPFETYRLPLSGNGGGQEILINRVEWCLHPTGHKYVGATSVGGASNANLSDAASWARVFPERKQIAIARLRTREF